MPSNAEVPDPTDWVGTPLASLSSLESALQCHVCKELFKTPMITSCLHTFCSLCIRRCLSQDGRCPACRTGDQESKLRMNLAMEECVNVYQKQRADLLNFARSIAVGAQNNAIDSSAPDERPRKRRRKDQTPDANTTSDVSTRATRSQSRMALHASQESREQSFVADSEDEGSQYGEDDSSSTPAKPSSGLEDGLVACPMCSKRMKEAAVFSHLDQCDGKARSSPRLKDPTPEKQPSTSVAYSVPSSTKARQRLGALNYSLLTETALRKKLSEIRIPSHGSKPLMQKRHMEWMSLWNASCDSSNPQTKQELLRELENWDRTQGRQIVNAQGPSGVMAKDFDTKAWTKSQKDDFADLIKRAKHKAPAPTTTAPNDDGHGKVDPSRPQDLKPTAHVEHSSKPNDLVDLTSPAKQPLEQQQQQSQGSQISGLTA
jgi:E3 ubiquitin-protein ligase RAD18